MMVLYGGQFAQPVIVETSVMDLPVLAEIVLAGTVVVPVEREAEAPSSVAGMALPTPLLVQGRGKDIVTVFGFIEDKAALLKMLPVEPSFRV